MDNIFSIVLAVAGLLWFGLLMAAFFGKLLTTLVSFLSKKRWKSEAIEAEAIVLHVEPTGLYINNKAQVKLQVQVKPGKGRNFVTEINDIEEVGIHELKAGSVVKVKYNPKNYRELLLIKAA